MKARSFIQSNLFIFIMAFMLGWCSYSLKLVSIIKLLGELDFSFYPLLMLVQGASFFISMKFMIHVSEKNNRVFYFLSLMTGLLVVFFTSSGPLNNMAQTHFGWAYSCAVFMLSTFIILSIDITTRMLVTDQISLLENPKASSHASFALESGVIFGASLTLGITRTMSPDSEILAPFAMTTPFWISLACLLLVSARVKEVAPAIDNQGIATALDQHTSNLKKNINKYLPFMVALFAIVLICKQLQGFAVFVGLREWQQSSQQSVATLFSILAILQNSLILLFLIPSFFTAGKSTSWSHGFNTYFLFQAASMLFISVYSFTASLIGTGIIRKITQRSFLNQSLNILLASIPQSIRFIIKSRSQKYGQTISFLVLALLSYLAINQYLAFETVWFITALFALSGLVVLYLLMQRLNVFHLNNIKEFCTCPYNVYEAITSCYALSNRDAARFYPQLTPMLQRNDIPPTLKKAIIHAIGEMKNEQSVNYLMDLFPQFPREDIQLQILIALNHFQRLDVDNFFQNVLRDTMYVDTKRGELKVSFSEVISRRMPEPTISLATKVIESTPNDFRVVGNAIDVLGEIAFRLRSRKILDYLSQFLAPHYPRRIRVNAIKHLYHLKKYRPTIDKIIASVHHSDILEDQTGAAYLYGVLGVSDYLPFIHALNEKTQRRHSTVLLSLLRLDQEGVERDIIDLLDEASTEEALVYINQIYRIREDKKRYKIYFALIQYYPDHVSKVLQLMRSSEKNFDNDRQIMVREAERHGIKIADDLIYQATINQILANR